jgi:hypothetical protein
VLGGLDERPAQAGRALAADRAQAGALAGGAHARDEAGVGAGLGGAREAARIAQLGDHEQGRVAADPGQGGEQLGAGIGLGAGVDLGGERRDLGVEGVDQAQQLLEPSPALRAELEPGQEGAPAAAEQVGVAALDPLAAEQGVDAVLERRAQLGQPDPLAEQLAELAQPGRAT